jgi:hypothetical protein
MGGSGKMGSGDGEWGKKGRGNGGSGKWGRGEWKLSWARPRIMKSRACIAGGGAVPSDEVILWLT